ncbi:MAG: alpha/beta hydrolase [Spirochaetaceae bacterium]|nr:MAG: alpha/beta hydrolase [Spirochaetaceae bacterium]
MRNRTVLIAVAIALVAGCASTPDPTLVRLAARHSPDRPFAESRFFTLASIRIHFRVWEPSGDPVGKIMMVHGTGASTVSFDRVAPLLADRGYAVVAADLPGFGFSALALDFEHSLDARASLMWSVADRLDTEENQFGPARRWILVGHEAGGAVATAMTLDRQSRTEALVVIGSNIADREHPGRFMWFPPVRWALRAWLRESLYTPGGVAELLTRAYGRQPTQDEVDRYAAPIVRPGMRDAFLNYRATAGPVDLALEDINTPLLAVWGTEDANVPPAAADRIVARVRDATVSLIEGAAHLPTDTHPSETAAALVVWLDGL